jgi:hypothetical protein
VRVAYLAENLGRVDRAWSLDADGLMHQTGHNIGNLAFWYAARLLFDAEEVHLVGRRARPSDVPRGVDVFVIPAANFINATADLSQVVDLVRGIDRPCVVIGLGAQAESEAEPPEVQPATLEFLREASRRAPVICVRGAFTETVCRRFGVENTTVLGCPSVLINSDPELGARLQRRIEALTREDAPGPYAVHAACIKGVLHSVERELVRLAQLHPGSAYVVQRPVELLKAGFGEPLSAEETAALRKAAAFLGFGPRLERLTAFLRAHILAPDSIDGWLHGLRRFAAAVNTRIHGTLMSVTAGVPGLCVWHDTRTRELCERLRLPHLQVRQFVETRYAVRDMFAAAGFDGAAFDANRREIAAGYAGVLAEAGLRPSAHLRSFL